MIDLVEFDFGVWTGDFDSSGLSHLYVVSADIADIVPDPIAVFPGGWCNREEGDPGLEGFIVDPTELILCAHELDEVLKALGRAGLGYDKIVSVKVGGEAFHVGVNYRIITSAMRPSVVSPLEYEIKNYESDFLDLLEDDAEPILSALWGLFKERMIDADKRDFQIVSLWGFDSISAVGVVDSSIHWGGGGGYWDPPEPEYMEAVFHGFVLDMKFDPDSMTVSSAVHLPDSNDLEIDF